MANTTNSLILVLLLFSLSNLTNCNQFSRAMSPKEIKKIESTRHTHLHFYFHDVVTGTNPTAVNVAQAPSITNSSAALFGLVMVADEVLTLGPRNDSKVVGRAQGMFTFADKMEFGLLMLVNFVFTEGEFNGSTLTMMGRNAINSLVREMSVVGGSGVFRYAQGHAEATTYELNPVTYNAIVEYNIYVSH